MEGREERVGRSPDASCQTGASALPPLAPQGGPSPGASGVPSAQLDAGLSSSQGSAEG